MESILEGNKLIAEFMGCKIRKDGKVVLSAPELLTGECLSKPKYHYSWDWLMPVVKKIYDYLQNIERPLVNHCWKGYLLEVDIACWIREVNIKKAHEAVIEFIKWYNTQPKTDKIK